MAFPKAQLNIIKNLWTALKARKSQICARKPTMYENMWAQLYILNNGKSKRLGWTIDWDVV